MTNTKIKMKTVPKAPYAMVTFTKATVAIATATVANFVGYCLSYQQLPW